MAGLSVHDFAVHDPEGCCFLEEPTIRSTIQPNFRAGPGMIRNPGGQKPPAISTHILREVRHPVCSRVMSSTRARDPRGATPGRRTCSGISGEAGSIAPGRRRRSGADSASEALMKVAPAGCSGKDSRFQPDGGIQAFHFFQLKAREAICRSERGSVNLAHRRAVGKWRGQCPRRQQPGERACSFEWTQLGL